MLVYLLLERDKLHQKTEKIIENKSTSENGHYQWKKQGIVSRDLKKWAADERT